MNLNRDQAAEMLRKAGLKATAQRVAILRTVWGDETHPTAQQLLDRLSTRQPGTNFATVYNTLNALTRVGLLRQMDVGGPTRFDPNAEPHHHAICDLCGTVRDVAVDPGGPERSLRLEGFEVHRVERTYRGTCDRCSSRQRSRKQQEG